MWIGGVLASVLLSGPARAAEPQTELNPWRGSLSSPVPAGMPGTWRGHVGQWAAELRYSYAQLPLVQEDGRPEPEVLVGRRSELGLKAGARLSEVISVHLRLPLGIQEARVDSALVSPGAFIGDPCLGAMAQSDDDRLSLGIDLGLCLPLASEGSWAGHPSARVEAELPMMYGDEAWGVALSPGVGIPLHGARSSTDLAMGGEGRLALGSWWRPSPTMPALTGALQLRSWWASVLTQDTAPASELLLGLRLGPRAGWRFDLGGGTGLSAGLGAPSMRLVASLAWTGSSREEAAPLVLVAELPAPADPAAEVDLPERDETMPAAAPEMVPPAPPLGRVLFARGSSALSPEALEELSALASRLNDAEPYPLILLEGHASREGNLGLNHRLSMERSLAIEQALVDRGVDPQRLVLRSRGATSSLPDDEQGVRSRRVEVRALAPLPQAPARKVLVEVRVPWAETPRTVVRFEEEEAP